MNHILLLGAGFSRNWDGWLASEVYDHLFTSSHILGDAHLQRVLRRTKDTGGFETALAEVQNDYILNHTPANLDHLHRLQAAIGDMYADMEAGFANKISMEFSNDGNSQIWKFLARFDAIFTLNQDLLLERHYLDGNLALASPRKWDGWRLPGMKVLFDGGRDGPFDCGKIKWTPEEPSAFRTYPNIQPYFKLHGSWNWWANHGEQMLVLGDNKISTIKRHPILNWYQEQFFAYLLRPDAKLMVIGYGFNDQHINQTIYAAWEKHQRLSMFIVHPWGREVLDKNRPMHIRIPNPLEELTNAGASTRPLSHTFGGDEGERRKIMRFFDS